MKTSIQNRTNEAASQAAVSTAGHQGPHRVANSRQPAAQSQLDSASQLGHRFDAVDVQPTLTLGPVDDRYEQQANQSAAQVMAHLSNPTIESVMPAVQRAPVAGHVQREMAAAPGVEGTGPVPDEIAASIDSARGGGHPLPSQIRSPLEQAFGARFSQVRLHSDIRAQSLNRRLSARAFTVGSDIFLREGAHAHHTPKGLRLLAHELTHTIQQTQSTSAARSAKARIQRDHVYTDDDLDQANLVQLPGNTANAVYKARYNRKLDKAKTKVGYFKPLSQDYTRHSVARSRATYKLSKGLGLNNVAKEAVARHTIGNQVTEGSLSAEVTDAVPLLRDGKPTTVDLKRPETQKGLSDLQLFDALTGQRDRHGGNIFVHPKTGKVTGIDQDLSFSEGVKPLRRDYPNATPEALREARQDPDQTMMAAHKYLGLPSLVDKKTAEKFLKLTPDKLREHLTLTDDVPLRKKDMDMALERLEMVQDHLRNLQENKRLVTTWNQDTFDSAREEEDVAGREDQAYPRSYLKRALRERVELQPDPEQAGDVQPGRERRQSLAELADWDEEGNE